MSLFKRHRCRSGATAIEYAMIAGMVALVMITAVGALGDKTKLNFESIERGFN
jgi:Flp pilus assembly pilin Flp